MRRTDWSLRAILMAIAVFLGMIALRPLWNPSIEAKAQSARFEHVQVVATTFLYKGQQGLLVLDRRNANVWFIPKVSDQFQTPVFVVKLPFDKLEP